MYKCDNMRIEDLSVITNTGRARPFRAPGHVQGTFGLDSIIDEMAIKLNIDPLEFRLKNYADIDQNSGLPYTSKLLKESYLKGADTFGWERRKDINNDGKVIKRGMGMASQIWWGGGSPPAHAVIKLNRDSSLDVLAGTQDIGTGTYTILAQVAAEVLELPMENINVVLGDTSVAPYCPSSGGSMTISSVAPAVRDAAEKVKSKLLSIAALSLNTGIDQLKYSKGEVIKEETGDTKRASINELLREIRESNIVEHGYREENKEGYAINSFGAQFAEVEVNTLTGNVKVIRITAAHDIGRPMNIKTLNNQFHGGIIQGIGFALMEERFVDGYTGKVVNTNMHAYKVPTVKDTPEIDVIIVSGNDPLISNIGAKGIGEPAIIPTAGAIANAVSHAVGKRIYSLPITPDKIINAISS
jgi:xanthine dehydrogenase YagR molybdenum-binding subunit